MFWQYRQEKSSFAMHFSSDLSALSSFHLKKILHVTNILQLVGMTYSKMGGSFVSSEANVVFKHKLACSFECIGKCYCGYLQCSSKVGIISDKEDWDGSQNLSLYTNVTGAVCNAGASLGLIQTIVVLTAGERTMEMRV